MQAKNAGEALYLASEMERRAVRLYERALLVFDRPDCQAAIRQILCEEKQHLARFEAMGAQAPGFEEGQALAAKASEVLFAGGLVEAQRKGAFESARALFAYAMEQESQAIACYDAFARQFPGETGAAFAAIAQEEQTHLAQFAALQNAQEKSEEA